MAKQNVTLEVLSYHATAPKECAVKLKVRTFIGSKQYSVLTEIIQLMFKY